MSPAAAIRAESHTTATRKLPGYDDHHRLDPAAHGTDAVPLGEQTLGPGRIPAPEEAAPADTGEDAQSRHDVRRSGREEALLVPVRRLGALEPAQQRPDKQRDRRHTQQHENREERGEGPQHDGDDRIGDDRAHTGPGHREHVRHVRDVGARDRRDLPGGELARKHRTDPGQMTQQNSRGARGRILADERHRPVPHDAEIGQPHARHDNRQNPQRQRLVVVAAQAVVDGPGDEIGPD